MHNGPLAGQKTRANMGKLFASKPSRRTKDVWSILTKLQVEEQHPGLGDVQSSHLQQAARIRCGLPED
jgi:hypothetical protein